MHPAGNNSRIFTSSLVPIRGCVTASRPGGTFGVMVPWCHGGRMPWCHGGMVDDGAVTCCRLHDTNERCLPQHYQSPTFCRELQGMCQTLAPPVSLQKLISRKWAAGFLRLLILSRCCTDGFMSSHCQCYYCCCKCAAAQAVKAELEALNLEDSKNWYP